MAQIQVSQTNPRLDYNPSQAEIETVKKMLEKIRKIEILECIPYVIMLSTFSFNRV